MRAVIAEDSVLLREGLARLLEEAGCEVVAQCENADDLLLKVRSFSPDVAIVDIRMPPTHNDEGLQAALEIRSKHPSVGVLVLSQYVEVGLALKLLAESAAGVGYLLKDRISDVKEFVAAVRIPVLANITEFGKTPLFTVKELHSVGVGLALYPLSAFRAMNAAALKVYRTLRSEGTQKRVVGMMQTRAELYEFLGYKK